MNINYNVIATIKMYITIKYLVLFRVLYSTNFSLDFSLEYGMNVLSLNSEKELYILKP